MLTWLTLAEEIENFEIYTTNFAHEIAGEIDQLRAIGDHAVASGHVGSLQVRTQGPGKVLTGVWLEVIGVDAPMLEAAGRA